VDATSLEVADIWRAYGESYRKLRGLNPQQERVMRAIIKCRTAELGGHRYACEQCGIITERFNSCRNRHCPKCQFLDKARWLDKRIEELLPVTYFHLVFTWPDPLINPLVRRNETLLYKMLFRVVADTLCEIAADPKHLGAKIGFLAVLHTWGQLLQLHSHLHVIVPGGGLANDRNKWISSKDDFFLPVRVLSRRMRNRFRQALDQAIDDGKIFFPEEIDPRREPDNYRRWHAELFEKEWVTYAKKPFGGKEKALAYLARYTYRVAISNDRLLRIEDDRVHFTYKDYADAGAWKDTSLEAHEFLRRYLMHVLPAGFHRIRYYGLFANRHRAANLERCRALLGAAPPQSQAVDADCEDPAEAWQEQLRRLTGVDPNRCPACKQGQLVYVEPIFRKQHHRAEPPEPAGRAPP
jgi:hypothetical protein